MYEKTITLEEFMHLRPGDADAPQSALAKVVVMAHMLSRAAQYMIQQSDSFNGIPPWDPRSDLAVIESDLIHLETCLRLRTPLPDIVAEHSGADGQIDQQRIGPVIFSRALFHLCYCILYHPFLLRKRASKCKMEYPSSLLSRSLDTSFTHAKELTALITAATEAGCLVQASFYGYCAMVAGYIVSLYTGSGDEKAQAEACSLLCANITYLENLGQRWKNASSLARSLRARQDTPLADVFAIQATALKQLAEVGYSFHPLVSKEGGMSLSPEEEDMLWSFVDYNTMSNGAPEPASVNDTGMGGVYWPDINEQWCDLFAPPDICFQ